MGDKNEWNVERESALEGEGIKQYRSLVDVFVTFDLDTLKNTPIDLVFKNGEVYPSSMPRAIVLTYGDDVKYFYPLVAVSSESFKSHYQSPFIRQNIIHEVSPSDELVKISYDVMGGYQAVLRSCGLSKEGFSKEKQNELESWLEKMSAVAKVFGGRELREIEEKYNLEGSVLGKGFARIVEDKVGGGK
jgi:hypothetical protein